MLSSALEENTYIHSTEPDATSNKVSCGDVDPESQIYDLSKPIEIKKTYPNNPVKGSLNINSL